MAVVLEHTGSVNGVGIELSWKSGLSLDQVSCRHDRIPSVGSVYAFQIFIRKTCLEEESEHVGRFRGRNHLQRVLYACQGSYLTPTVMKISFSVATPAHGRFANSGSGSTVSAWHDW